jgi:titin
MTGTVYVGLAVSSHTDGTNGTAVFDNVTITTPAPPAAPSGLVASGGVNQAVLEWTDNANNETGFKIERKVASAADSTYAQVGTAGANALTFTNTGVPAGDYSYRVRATNANGDSSFSNAAAATVVNPAPPAAPSGLTANGGVSQAVLGWSDNSSNETGFKIERKVSGADDSTFAEVGTVGANVVTFTNSGVPGGVYTYRVKATSTVGDSGYSSSTDATITDPPPPSAPSGLTASGGVSQAVLGWTDNSNNETTFRIERKVAGGDDSTFTEVGTTGTNAVTFTNSGVPGGAYTYRVRASNTVGSSAYSNSADAVITDPQPPAAPSALTVMGGVGQAVLSWTDNADNETGFEIDRKASSDPDTSFAQVGTAAANAQGFTDSALPAGTYTYRVRATNAVGDSGNSNSAEGTVSAPSGPAAPSNLAASTATGNSAILTWTDNSSNETGFRVERKVGAGTYATLFTTAANVVTYTNGSLGAGTYTYRVLATGSPVSAPSNEVVVIINNPVADSYVREGTNAGINYGTETAVRIKLNSTVANNRSGYLRFSLAGVGATVTSAKLRLYGVATTNAKFVNVHPVASTTWIESGTGGITFSNAPAMGTALLGKNITTTAAYVEWDITAHVQAQRTANATALSLGLKTTSNFPDAETVINSRENAANKPILIISSRP